MTWARHGGCKVNRFYIKPQHLLELLPYVVGCKVNRFYIKPQHKSGRIVARNVVKLIDSTSNHNHFFLSDLLPVVVKLIDSTSNHNYADVLIIM